MDIRKKDLTNLQLDLVKAKKIIHQVEVYYDHLKSGDINPFLKMINFLEISQGTNNCRCSCTIHFRKYPKEDGKQDFELDIIRNWVQKLYKEIPHFFYYLNEIDTLEPSRRIFLTLADIECYQLFDNKVVNIRFFEEETRKTALEIYNKTILYEKEKHGTNSEELKKTLKDVMRPFI